ncbi:DUF421 domain-containing protein [Caldibacillus lycopersici]|uniref:DUF421 domain-containing protein n=1 Tax=Perspicuibacillus lycopersici TaxID=1325689 RepID=A0AAE3LPJ6_9BACI|nr:DUF421 domain-containing protein [Perspicuibacillus lycopersici]MCU9612414.1 DUF421 domain-containing protein [Perspicuibacillus lycopersici]
MDFFHIFIELMIGYIALLLLTKILGKSQMSQITAFDFISALVLGELVGNALFDDEIGIAKILFAVSIWGVLVYVTEITTQKFRKTRPILEGGPSIVISKGLIDFDALKKNHLDINQLQHLLRLQGVFSIQECEFAILETDGQVSVLKKAANDYVTKNELNIANQTRSLPVSIILDGEIIPDNLAMIGWNQQQLMTELNNKGIDHVRDVLFAEWVENEPLYIQPYQ